MKSNTDLLLPAWNNYHTIIFSACKQRNWHV